MLEEDAISEIGRTWVIGLAAWTGRILATDREMATGPICLDVWGEIIRLLAISATFWGWTNHCVQTHNQGDASLRNLVSRIALDWETDREQVIASARTTR